MASNIPLPNPNNYQMFNDAFDYLEKVRSAKAGEAGNKAKLEEQQRQFGLTNQLEQQKAAEMARYHQGSLALLKDKIEAMKSGKTGFKNLSAQERSEAMKLLHQGQAAISLINKTNVMEGQLTKNPDLTGKLPWLMNKLGAGGEDLGNFTTLAGDIQAGVARLGSQRGGAQALQWAEKIKANDWKDTNTNLGHTRGLRDSTKSDLQEIANEYEAITGEKYPLQVGGVGGASGVTGGKIGREQVTEENIQHTMKETGLSRDQVMAKLKERGLA